MANTNLNKAKEAKNDEFYTQIFDIENELNKHKEFLRGKKVFMPCDDPELMNDLLGDTGEDKASKFWVFFHKNFERLGLKKISATHYSPEGNAYMIEYTGGNDSDIMEFKRTNLKGDGDFRSDEIKTLMKGSDVIITNPPFSLFRDFIQLLVDIKLKFIIIGPKGAIQYKDYFPLVKENKVWAGYTNVKEFIAVTPDNKITRKKFGNIGWWTNVETNKRKEELFLFEKYNKRKYDDVETYDAIMVNRVKEIPVDYDGPMAVPTSYIDYHNPSMFEIIGMDQLYGYPATYVKGKKKFRRMIIKRRK